MNDPSIQYFCAVFLVWVVTYSEWAQVLILRKKANKHISKYVTECCSLYVVVLHPLFVWCHRDFCGIKGNSHFFPPQTLLVVCDSLQHFVIPSLLLNKTSFISVHFIFHSLSPLLHPLCPLLFFSSFKGGLCSTDSSLHTLSFKLKRCIVELKKKRKKEKKMLGIEKDRERSDGLFFSWLNASQPSYLLSGEVR